MTQPVTPLAGSGAIPVQHDPFAAGDLLAALSPTAPQQELWVASKVGGADASRAFNECVSVMMRGELNADLLAAAWQALIDRHEALRCCFTPDGERFTVLTGDESALVRHDLSALSPDERARRIDQLQRSEVEAPFELEKTPLYRASLLRLAPGEHQLIFCAHHVICDGWSAGVLLQELAAMYRSGVSRWPALPRPSDAGLDPAPSFAAYASSLRTRAQGPEGAADEAFWIKQLSGTIKALDLPTDRAYPPRRTYASQRVDLPLDPRLLAPLRQLGARSGCTFLVTMMGAFQVWASRLTGQRDLVIGMPAAGQAAVGAESLVGHCVHVLPIRATVDTSKTFSEHLTSIKPGMLDAVDHQQVTFSRLLRSLSIPFDPSRIPLIPVCLNVEAGLSKLDFGPVAAQFESVPRAFESFELFVNAVDHRDRLVMEWSYNTALFDETTIRRWMRSFETLIADLIARPTAPLKSLALLGPDEVQLLVDVNATQRPLAGKPVHERVAAQAVERANQVAVQFGQQSLTYAQLDRRANQLAHRLRKEGVRERDCVGVCLERSEQLPVVLLAVLKCGAAYVPMDPGYPPARLAMMAEDGAVKLVITESAVAAAAPAVERMLRLDAIAAELGAEPAEAPAVAVKGEDRAYVLFTSGSTGRPKGVEVPHRALENFLVSMQREPGFAAGDSLLAVTTISFDIAGLEMFLPLVSGGRVVIATRAAASDPEALGKLLEAEGITVMQATPATWRMLVDSGWRGRDELRVLCGGEPLTESLLAALGSRVHEIWNMYGPTETTVWSTVKLMRPGQRITIGRPIDNTRIYVLDGDLGTMPIGATGEIWIAGDGVALGYIGREELTRERFLDSPFVPGERMYRTGDLGRVLADGDIECLGRSDFQVKLRGFRIELGEIEAALERFPGVRKGVVSLFARTADDQQLAAYYVTEGGPADLDALKKHLNGALPPYMVPQFFVQMEKLPLTPAGKVDRKSLPAPAAPARGGGDGEALRDDIDVAIAEIWQNLLGVEQIGLDDDFFALGGHSLLAVRFVNAVEARLGMTFTLAGLFAGSSLRAVADAIRSGGGNFATGAVMLRKEPGAPRVFFICGVHLYRLAAQSLGQGIESYGVVVAADEQLTKALQTNSAPTVDVRELVADYLEAVRKVQPHGPYHLAGVSFGGVLAYELARLLRESGEEVRLLALLDPILPSSVHANRKEQFQRFLKAEAIWNLGAKMARALVDQGQRLVRQHGDDEAAADRLGEMRNAAYDAAMGTWEKTASAYTGDAILFRATDLSDYPGMSFNADLGWRRLIRGKFETFDLPGNHLGILRTPNVYKLAAIIRERVLPRAK
jgi:amino acid adenylation domain-containing protein